MKSIALFILLAASSVMASSAQAATLESGKYAPLARYCAMKLIVEESALTVIYINNPNYQERCSDAGVAKRYTLGMITVNGSSIEAYYTTGKKGGWTQAIEVIDSQTFIKHGGNESLAYELFY